MAGINPRDLAAQDQHHHPFANLNAPCVNAQEAPVHLRRFDGCRKAAALVVFSPERPLHDIVIGGTGLCRSHCDSFCVAVETAQTYENARAYGVCRRA